MAETYRPSKGMQEAAKRALGWLKEGKAGSGFTDVGRKRASDIAAGRSLSAQTVLRMYSFFARHEVDKKATGFNSGEEGFPTPGRVAWDAWGGDAGFSWSTKIRNQLQKSVRALQIMTSEEGDTMADSTQAPELQEELIELLADTITFYFKAHSAHWNVVGTDFAEYHELFAKIYEDVYGSIDPIAENVRKLGFKAPQSLTEILMIRSMDDSADSSSDARVLANNLLQMNDELVSSIAYTFQCANEYNQQGIANFLAERLDAHQMWKWQLSASLGIEAQPIDLTVMPDEEDEEYVLDTEDDQMPEESSASDAQKILESPSNEDASARNAEISSVETAKSEDGSMIEERKMAIRTAEKITMAAEVRAIRAEDGSLRIGGYAATFNKEATGLNFREVIAPGAFTRTLASGNPVFLLINHDMDALPLASTQSGTLKLSQDNVGLRMEAELDPKNPRAVELASALERGDVDKMSFAFSVAPDGDNKEDGLRTLTDLDLFEVSVVTFPAYDSTSVGMRSQADDLSIRQRLLKAKLTHSRLRK